MKIYIKPNWSEQFIYGDKETPGFFVGRENEISALKNVIVGNDSSAVLVSSVRGVGKTSFVHKALSKIENAYPIFVNIGHALANTDNHNSENINVKNNKRRILVSLIRATHFNAKFSNDGELTNLYNECFGRAKEEKNESVELDEENESKKSIGAKIDIPKLLLTVSGFLLGVAVFAENLGVRIISGVISSGSLFFSFNWEHSWTKKIAKKLFSNKSLVIENSTEYLEIRFETWLRDRNKDTKSKEKLVFVIDELDKIDAKEAFEMIKEYKNLFNRSFAHFVFISSQEAFNLVNQSRENSAGEGGIFPTMFTHIFYLSLPKTEELTKYLNEIFDSSEVEKDKKEELVRYLLFRSGNDFFELKRLISDFLCFDNEDKPYIDTEKIREGDLSYKRASIMFNFIDSWFLTKNLKDLKKHWKDNSEIQKKVFDFLNAKFPNNFKEPEVDARILRKLVKFLVDIGALTSEKVVVNANVLPNVTELIYKWTHKYKRGVEAPLDEEDKKFINSFNALIKLANDLDELPEHYKDGGYSDHDSVLENQDGQEFSGINLYATFSDYEDMFDSLKDPSTRISIDTQQVKDGTETVEEQVENVYDRYFDIYLKLLDRILKDNNNVFRRESIDSANYNINALATSLPGFRSVVVPETYRVHVLGRTDQTKYVLILEDFDKADEIEPALNALKARQDVLILNLMYGDKHQITQQKTFSNILGRKIKNGSAVKNFINYEFNDMRQLGGALTKIFDFLTEGK